MPITRVAKRRQRAKARDIQAAFDKLFEAPLVNQLERMREQARKKRRIVYDCFKAQVMNDGRVWCPHYILNRQSNDGRRSLAEVLRGRALTVCETCRFYDADD